MIVAIAVAFLALLAIAQIQKRARRPTRASVPLAPEGADPIDVFWTWWDMAKGPFAQVLETGEAREWYAALNERVEAIDSRLAWELGPGKASQHHVCVSAEGDAVLRVTAERWLSRAPAPDAVWEYCAARQPSGADRKMVLKLDGVKIEYPDFRFGLEVDRLRRVIHVVVHHPRLSTLAERSRKMAMMLALDDLLGEDGVERWVGGVEPASDPAAVTEDGARLIALVGELAASETSYGTAERTDDEGRRKTEVVHFGVKRLDHLLMTSHIEVTIRYEARPDGFYDAPLGEEINEMQEALVEALGLDAVYLAHETGGRSAHHPPTRRSDGARPGADYGVGTKVPYVGDPEQLECGIPSGR